MPQTYNMNITHLLHRCYNIITNFLALLFLPVDATFRGVSLDQFWCFFASAVQLLIKSLFASV